MDHTERRSAGRRAFAVAAAGIMIVILIVIVPLVGCRPAGRVPEAGGGTAAVDPRVGIPAEERASVEKFCADCHRLPLAESFPRSHWPEEVQQGFDLYALSERTDLSPPSAAATIRYFQAGAPEALLIPPAFERHDTPSPVTFQALPLSAEAIGQNPAIADIKVLPGPQGSNAVDLLTTDMRSGEIRRWSLVGPKVSTRVIARGSSPCRLTAVSPASGFPSRWLVGDLGGFMPEDHHRGRVCAVDDAAPDAPAADVSLVAADLARVVEVTPFDYDADGRTDLLVAEFGWRQTGSLCVLLAGGEGASEGFDDRRQIIDPRAGAIGVRTADIDGDGRDDIVAAFAQEHETVDVWFQSGAGTYEHREIIRFPDPSFGSSGFELIDLDADGRIDILHTNGDTLDSGLAKPTHGIRCLFNLGEGRFRSQEIARMPGASQASAADIDGDGDLDIVACSLLPAAGTHPAGTFDSILWFENGGSGTYLPHRIQRNHCDHAAFALADLNGDGRIDLLTGTWEAAESQRPTWALEVWLNFPAAGQ